MAKNQNEEPDDPFKLGSSGRDSCSSHDLQTVSHWFDLSCKDFFWNDKKYLYVLLCLQMDRLLTIPRV